MQPCRVATSNSLQDTKKTTGQRLHVTVYNSNVESLYPDRTVKIDNHDKQYNNMIMF